jgi:NAD-dependent SIR2 family protein deacetylase
MPSYTVQDIDEIADAFRSGKGRSKPAHILFGAGCSKSAGVPLAREIVKDIHKNYSNYVNKLDPDDRHRYGACMKKLAPNERRDLIAGYLEKAKLNWAHIALAELMCCGFIDRALTVNFDNILARACGLISLYPAIYDFATAPTANVSLIVSPAIVHLHGQGHGVVLLNTEEETKKHSEKIEPIMRQSLSDHPLLVIGYSGEADDVLRLVHQHYQNSEHLYWASFDEEPAEPIRELSKKHEYFHPVGGADADRFLIELAQRLNCWPPAFCRDPIGHLIAELEPVLDYPTTKDSGSDVLASTRRRLTNLQKIEQDERGSLEQITSDFLAGHDEKVVEAFEKQKGAGAISDEARELVAAALLNHGNRAFLGAKKASDPANANRLFQAAAEQYEAALTIKPDQHEALNNLGLTLLERGKRASDRADADRLFAAAVEKYEASVKIKPGEPEALFGWGNTLAGRAKRASDPAEADRLLAAAAEKYEAALKIKPDKHEVLNNWASLLIQRAHRAPDPVDRERLLAEAEEKGREALKLNPGNTYNLACVMALRSRTDECREFLYQPAD